MKNVCIVSDRNDQSIATNCKNTPCKQEKHDSLMGCWGGVAWHGLWAQPDGEQNKPEDAKKHRDSKLVP